VKSVEVHTQDGVFVSCSVPVQLHSLILH